MSERQVGDLSPFLTTEEGASYLRIHPRTLARKARLGDIPAFQIGRQWRFRRADLDAWVASKISSGTKLKALSALTEKGDLA